MKPCKFLWQTWTKCDDDDDEKCDDKDEKCDDDDNNYEAPSPQPQTTSSLNWAVSLF